MPKKLTVQFDDTLYCVAQGTVDVEHEHFHTGSEHRLKITFLGPLGNTTTQLSLTLEESLILSLALKQMAKDALKP